MFGRQHRIDRTSAASEFGAPKRNLRRKRMRRQNRDRVVRPDTKPVEKICRLPDTADELPICQDLISFGRTHFSQIANSRSIRRFRGARLNQGEGCLLREIFVKPADFDFGNVRCVSDLQMIMHAVSSQVDALGRSTPPPRYSFVIEDLRPFS